MTSVSFRSYFSWLSPEFRPSRREVETYARLISAHEGCTSGDLSEYRRQAELQLWLWRAENNGRGTPARSRRRPTQEAAFAS